MDTNDADLTADMTDTERNVFRSMLIHPSNQGPKCQTLKHRQRLAQHARKVAASQEKTPVSA